MDHSDQPGTLSPVSANLDALVPAAIARKAEDIGVAKTEMEFARLAVEAEAHSVEGPQPDVALASVIFAVQ